MAKYATGPSWQLALPPGIAEDKIEAKFEKGVLNVTLPKMPEEQNPARKIAVKGGNG